MGLAMATSNCTFCNVGPGDAWMSTDLVVAMLHPEPIGPCHLMVAPRRHVPAFYDLDLQEQRQLWDALAELRLRIAATIVVMGFDAGFVDAPRGQEDTFHTFIHLVPRIQNHPSLLPPGPEWVDLG